MSSPRMALSSPGYRILPTNLIHTTLVSRLRCDVFVNYDISTDAICAKVRGGPLATYPGHKAVYTVEGMTDICSSLLGQLTYGPDWYTQYEHALAMHRAYISR